MAEERITFTPVDEIPVDASAPYTEDEMRGMISIARGDEMAVARCPRCLRRADAWALSSMLEQVLDERKA